MKVWQKRKNGLSRRLGHVGKKRVADGLETLVHYDNGASCDVFVDLMIDGTFHVVTLDALVDALEEAQRVGHKIDSCIRCITVASRTPN
jgi:hypothetical protein